MDAIIPPSEFTVRTILLAICFGTFAFNFWRWVKELGFYRRNNWNFNLDSKIGQMPHLIDYAPPQYLSHAARVKIGYPINLVILILLMIASVFAEIAN